MTWEDWISLLILAPVVLLIVVVMVAVAWDLFAGLLPGRKSHRDIGLHKLKKEKTWWHSERFFKDFGYGPISEKYENLVRFVPPGEVTLHDNGRYIVGRGKNTTFTTNGTDVRDEGQNELWLDPNKWFGTLQNQKMDELFADLPQHLEEGSVETLPTLIDRLRTHEIFLADFEGDLIEWVRGHVLWEIDDEEYEQFVTNIDILLESGEDELAGTPLEWIGSGADSAGNFWLYNEPGESFRVHSLYVDPYHYATRTETITNPYDLIYRFVLKPNLDEAFRPWKLV